MAANSVTSAVDIEEEIFNMLKRRGPQCSSQIAVEVGVSLKKVTAALKGLQDEGLVELRPDHDRSIHFDESETPWGLTRSNWLHKIKTR